MAKDSRNDEIKTTIHPGLRPDQLPIEVPAGTETVVPKGMTMAPGVIPHPDQKTYPGVLVMEANHDVVVRWHNHGCGRANVPLHPKDVKFDRNGAPWCPTCFAENLARDPNWNLETPESVTPVPNAINSPTDPNRLSDRTSRYEQERREKRLEAMRQHRHAGEFRDPGPQIVSREQIEKLRNPENPKLPTDYTNVERLD